MGRSSLEATKACLIRAVRADRALCDAWLGTGLRRLTALFAFGLLLVVFEVLDLVVEAELPPALDDCAVDDCPATGKTATSSPSATAMHAIGASGEKFTLISTLYPFSRFIEVANEFPALPISISVWF
jgi:hypothetical protein